MSEPTEFYAKCPPSYEELVRRLEKLEQEVAQMRDALASTLSDTAYEDYRANQQP